MDSNNVINFNISIYVYLMHEVIIIYFIFQMEHEHMTFVWTEIAFLSMWYNEVLRYF